MAGEIERGDFVQAHRMAGVEHIGEGDFLPAGYGFDEDVVVLDQQGQLLGQVVGEDRRLGDADAVFARRDEAAE